MKRKVNNLFISFSELTVVEKLADPGLLKDTFTMLLAEIFNESKFSRKRYVI